MKERLDEADIADQTGPLQQAAGQQFYNASPFTLRDLRSATSQQQLRDNFNAYLDGFSPNVQDILEKFEFRNQDRPALQWRGARRTDRAVPHPRP